MEQEKNTSLFGLGIEQETSIILRNTSSWARMLAIAGFIMGAISVFAGIVLKISLSNARSYEGYEAEREFQNMMSLSGNVVLLLYLVIGLVIIVSSVFALGFARKAIAALNRNDQSALNASFSSLRNYFSLWAIVMILVLLLMVLSFLSLILSL